MKQILKSFLNVKFLNIDSPIKAKFAHETAMVQQEKKKYNTLISVMSNEALSSNLSQKIHQKHKFAT